MISKSKYKKSINSLNHTRMIGTELTDIREEKPRKNKLDWIPSEQVVIVNLLKEIKEILLRIEKK